MPSSVSDNEEENTFMVSAADDIVEMIMARTSHTGGTLDLSESLDNRGLDSMEVVSLIFDIEEKFNIQIPLNAMVIRRQLKRRSVLSFFQKVPPCLIGMEACATSHHWSRELQALGHRVRLMPPNSLPYPTPHPELKRKQAFVSKPPRILAPLNSQAELNI
jgi:acyl carrier protein